MKKKIGMYFQLETDDKKESLSIVKQALTRLDQLEDEGMDVQYFELRVKKAKELRNTNFVSMKLDGNGSTFIENESAFHWEEAFMNGFDKIYDQLKIRNGSFAKVLQYA